VATTLDRVQSGITGLDAMLGGGLPRGRTTLLLGGPGAGKTLLALQILAEGARRFREPGIFVSFEEDPARIRDHIKHFPWAPTRASARRLAFVDGRPIRTALHSGNFDLLALLAQLDVRVRATGAKRIAFDGLDVLLHLLDDDASVRREIYRLHDWLAARRLSGFLTSQVADDGTALSGYLAFLPFMADSIVSLRHTLTDRIAERTLRVIKCRGVAHSSDEMPMIIGPGGIEVLPTSTDALDYGVSTQRVSTGVERLDAMLGGGYYRRSCTLISGSPGTAKTTLAGAFLLAACQRGEPALFASFDESGPQIVRNLASVNLRLAPHVRSGLLRLASSQVRGSGIDLHLSQLRARVAAEGIRCLAIDPVSALGQGGLPAHLQQGVVRFVNDMKRLGVTLLLTSLLEDSGASEATVTGVSTIADTWIHLSYVVHGGERNRALTVVKSRGTAHSSQVRELLLSSRGLTLADVYTAGGQVIMGTLRWEREEQDRLERAREAADAARRRSEAQHALAEARMGVAAAQRVVAEQEAVVQRLKETDAKVAARRLKRRHTIGALRKEDRREQGE